MQCNLPVLAAGMPLPEIYVVYARLRNALRIIVRIQLSGIAEFAINRSPPETQLPKKSTPLIDRRLNEDLNESIGRNHLYEKPVIPPSGSNRISQDFAEVCVAALTDAEQFRLASGRILTWHDSEPSSELSGLAEGAPVANRRHDSCCDNLANAGNLTDAGASCIADMPDEPP
jgi:hypothetical protein